MTLTPTPCSRCGRRDPNPGCYVCADESPEHKNTTNMKHTYHPRPFRESYGSRDAHDIQRDLELMRAMYASRRNLNAPRHQRMVGVGLMAALVGIPALAAIVILIFR